MGETTAKTLAKAVIHLNEFKDWDEAQLCTLEDIGPKVANAVFQFFRNEDNILLIEHLEQLGVNVQRKTAVSTENAEGGLNGQTFLFTGTLSHFKRSDAEAMVEAKGGKLLSGVSSKLNYLVVGADAGSKLEKAKKLTTINILTEEAFLDMMNTLS
ncbi:DNA ligase [compost metagenome]